MSTPVIECRFQHATPLGCEPAALVAALQEYVDVHLGPVWDVACQLTTSPAGPSAWTLLFADDADQAGALGYHDDPVGPAPPRGFVFVRTSQRAGEHVSVTASHELAELLIDPATNLGALSPRGRWVALEVCDPVQREEFEVGGLPVSDFVCPAWFGQGGDRYDHLGRCRWPWEILPGGYVPVWENGRWRQMFGHWAEKIRWGTQDRRMKRTERRATSRRPPLARATAVPGVFA